MHARLLLKELMQEVFYPRIRLNATAKAEKRAQMAFSNILLKDNLKIYLFWKVLSPAGTHWTLHCPFWSG